MRRLYSPFPLYQQGFTQRLRTLGAQGENPPDSQTTVALSRYLQSLVDEGTITFDEAMAVVNGDVNIDDLLGYPAPSEPSEQPGPPTHGDPGLEWGAGSSNTFFIFGGLVLLFFVGGWSGGWTARPAYESIRASRKRQQIARLRDEISALQKELR